jgi:hypothetical protein
MQLKKRKGNEIGLTFFKHAEFFLAEMKDQWDEGSGRKNTAGR